MKLYRCITKEQYNLLKEGIIKLENSSPDYGNNNFEYDDDKYLHFFVFPECANYYRDISNEYCYVISINVPNTSDFELGFGEYKMGLVRNSLHYGDVICSGMLDSMLLPFPEVRIPTKYITLDLLENIDYYADDIGDGDNYFNHMLELINDKCLTGTDEDYLELLEEVEFMGSDIKKTK